MNAKMKVSSEDLCEDLPEEIYNVLEYVRSLSFYADPDYYFIISELSYLIEGTGGELSYDWEMRTSLGRHRGDCLDIVVNAANSGEKGLDVLGEDAVEESKAWSVEIIEEIPTDPRNVI